MAMAMSTRALARMQSKTLLSRAVSTSPITNEDGSYSFIKARSAYRSEISSMRKDFMDEVKRREEKMARDAEAQRQKIMKEKAARLAIKREKQAIRAEEVAREKAAHEERVRQIFAEKALVRQAHMEDEAKRREAIVQVLSEQTDEWVTEDNVESKLSEELFTYTPQQRSSPSSFDPSAAASSPASAASWLEKLQRMRPPEASSNAAAEDVAASADDKDGDKKE